MFEIILPFSQCLIVESQVISTDEGNKRGINFDLLFDLSLILAEALAASMNNFSCQQLKLVGGWGKLHKV